VFNEWSRFQAARRTHLAAPDQAEVRNGLFIDLVQRTEALIVIGPAIQEPIGEGGLRGDRFFAVANYKSTPRCKDEKSEQPTNLN